MKINKIILKTLKVRHRNQEEKHKKKNYEKSTSTKLEVRCPYALPRDGSVVETILTLP
jgi:hypothetical protein